MAIKKEKETKEEVKKVKKKKVVKSKEKENTKKNTNKKINIDKETYTVKDVIIIMLFSLGIGFLMCFGCINLITGKNYIATMKDLDKVISTYYAIVDNYYGDLDKEALINGAVEGMIYEVGDSFTSYSDVEDTKNFNETIKGSYEGIGCNMATYEDNKKVVLEVFPSSPAEKSGVKVGDIILEVDGKDYRDKSGNDVAKYIKDSGKTKVTLTVDRSGEEKKIEINLSKVEIPYVTSNVFERNNKKVGYIKISLFSSTAYKQFESELKKIEKEKIDNLIIDVRNNNGGYLSSVTDISNIFLEKGKIIYNLEDSNGKLAKKDNTREKRNYKIAVLINENSASASEILAATIKESYKDGIVVGTKSYGKGTVQQTRKLLDGSMIKYTTQRWLTPEGNCINEKGIEPTNIVNESEEFLNNPCVDTDNQLQEAINILSK